MLYMLHNLLLNRRSWKWRNFLELFVLRARFSIAVLQICIHCYCCRDVLCFVAMNTFPFLRRDSPHRARTSSFTMFLDHTQRHTTVGRTPLDEWSARRRALYLTTHNNHNTQTSMPPVGFEPAISAGERPQTYVLTRAATGTGSNKNTTI